MHRPTVTFALLTFNQERFVAEALHSILAQTYQPLEILICDDCSTDETIPIVEREIAIYRGPHRITFHKNEVNLGCTGNTLSALSLAKSDLVVFGAGDDISEPNRVEEIAAVAAADSSVYSFWSPARLIDEDGSDLGEIADFATDDESLLGIAKSGWAPSGSTLACRKAVGSMFGPVDRRAASEDIILHFRAALLGGIGKSLLPLVRWRRHAGSMESIGLIYAEGSVAEMVTSNRQVIEQRLYCFRQRQSDLQTAIALWPARFVEPNNLGVSVERTICDCKSLQMLIKGGFVMNCLGVIKGFRAGRTFREMVKRFIMLRLPKVWLRLVQNAGNAPRKT